MNSFKELDLELSYKTDKENSILNKFYIPVLKKSKLYKRSVGYFTSNVLIKISEGIEGLVENNGKMKLLISPQISNEDKDAISKGYKLKEDVVRESLLIEFNKSYDNYQEEKLNYLANMIAYDVLEIKVACMKNYGIYHEKIGILEDIETNKIAFTGSLNETENAMVNNFESIDIYKSWNESDEKRVIQKLNNFESLWNNENDLVEVMEFPDAVKNKLLKFKTNDVVKEAQLKLCVKKKKKNIPEIPELIGDKPFEIRDYQKEAINSWQENDYKGILAMATGTGKTLTALLCLEKLWQEKKRLAVIIICPYIHLVEQWIEDLERFNIRPIKICGSNKKNIERAEMQIECYQENINPFICIITTNQSYSKPKFQKLINEIEEQTLFIADEVHNVGAKNTSRCLNENYKYRLGLSATPKRYFDDIGTDKIYDYFKKDVYEFSLKEAIDKEFLTQYYYYPIFVYLDQDELIEYKKITKKILKYLDKDGKLDLSNSQLSNLLIKRSRIVNLASSKVQKLKEIMLENKLCKENNILIYCAAGKKDDEDRQITQVCKLLGNKLDMRIRRFTSEEDMNERTMIVDEFKQKILQGIVAIKCLDEGVNIPCIETAIILSSSGNSKEFIQRRGRVLRNSPGKDFAKIYDFITLPYDIEKIDIEECSTDKSIVKKELRRAEEFADTCLNKSHAFNTIMEIKDNFELWEDENEQYK